ncbi:hypothetical protein [Microvirga makkahensis]|uniref:Uncharacterized protein n=1 Tax=Microvirga makkahensis TaxID=1128670 RepID=A0A7X3MNU6_9HYPH|nr:hypothetical protein [Microvirga makkahensis]MXQ10270.1 hypothetical protein [Microvirga makkahensis]
MAKAKVPKKVAGVKVPKALRNSDLVEALIQNETVRRILADALIAAAGAAAAVLTRKVAPSEESIAGAGETVVDTGSKAASATADLAGGVASALGRVVADAASSLLPDGTGAGDGKKRRKSRDKEAKA